MFSCLHNTQHKLTILRNKKTSSADFRHVLKEVTTYLGFEATRCLKLVDEVVDTPDQLNYTGHRIGMTSK